MNNNEINNDTIEQPNVNSNQIEQPVINNNMVEQPSVNSNQIEQPIINNDTVEQPSVNSNQIEQPVINNNPNTNNIIKNKKTKKILIFASIISIFVITIILLSIIFNNSNDIKSFILNKTWIGYSESYHIYTNDGDSLTIPSRHEMNIEFYDNNKYILYDFDWSNSYIILLTFGTYSIKNDIITLNAERVTRNNQTFESVDYKRELVYDKSTNTFYFYNSANKYIYEVSSNGSINNNQNKEKVKYKINFEYINNYYLNYYNGKNI